MRYPHYIFLRRRRKVKKAAGSKDAAELVARSNMSGRSRCLAFAGFPEYHTVRSTGAGAGASVFGAARPAADIRRSALYPANVGFVQRLHAMLSTAFQNARAADGRAA